MNWQGQVEVLDIIVCWIEDYDRNYDLYEEVSIPKLDQQSMIWTKSISKFRN